MRQWRRSIMTKPSRRQIDALVELAHRVESLWQLTLRRLQIAEHEARRRIPLWGREREEHTPAVGREQIEAILNDPDGSYMRLRRVMDAWAALWFWPLDRADMLDGTAPEYTDARASITRIEEEPVYAETPIPETWQHGSLFDLDGPKAGSGWRKKRCIGRQESLNEILCLRSKPFDHLVKLTEIFR